MITDTYDLRLLLRSDVPRVEGPQRDLREDMYEKFLKEVKKRQYGYIAVDSPWDERFENVRK